MNPGVKLNKKLYLLVARVCCDEGVKVVFCWVVGFKVVFCWVVGVRVVFCWVVGVRVVNVTHVIQMLMLKCKLVNVSQIRCLCVMNK